MSVLDIEPAGFQTLEHRFNGSSFLVRRKGFLGVAEGYKDLRVGFPALVLDHGSRQVAELSADAVDVVQNPLLPMFEIIKDVLGTYLRPTPHLRCFFCASGLDLTNVKRAIFLILGSVHIPLIDYRL